MLQNFDRPAWWARRWLLFDWDKSAKERRNVEVSLTTVDVVTVSIVVMGTGFRTDLTPDQADEMAEGLRLLAQTVREHAGERSG